MSYYLDFDGEQVAQIASNTGWGDFCRWTEGLDADDYAEVVHLAAYSWCQNLDDLSAQLAAAADAKPPEDTVASTVQMILETLAERGDAETCNVSDGLSSEEDEVQESKDAQGHGSDKKDERHTSESDLHADAAHALQKPSLVAKMKSLPAKVASAAKKSATNLYQKTEKKYGPRWAKAILATCIITLPTPFTTVAVGAMTGLAYLHSKYAAKQPGAVHESAETAMSDDEVLAAADEFLKELLAAMPNEE